MSDKKIKIIGISCSYVVTVFNSTDFSQSWSGILLELGVLLTTSYIKWESVLAIIRVSRKRYPHLHQVRQRVYFTLTYAFLLLMGVYFLLKYSYSILVAGSHFLFGWHQLLVLIVGSLNFSMTSVGLFEAVYYFSNYNRTLLEKEELKRANLQAQLDSLKRQVQPHFLFNSLNSLSALIITAPEKAELFVEDLSAVYRYLLRGYEKDFVQLKEEIQFIQSYNYLLTTRYGDNLRIDLCISPPCLDLLLLPFTLQLLIENAVKHNIISSQHPLLISIYTNDKKELIVVNSLQKKMRGVLSEKKGLANIISKYQLLYLPLPEIQETEKEFIVTIPLVAAKESAVGILC